MDGTWFFESITEAQTSPGKFVTSDLVAFLIAAAAMMITPELEQLLHDVQELKQSLVAHQKQGSSAFEDTSDSIAVSGYRQAVSELTRLNEHLYIYVGNQNSRITALETQNSHLQAAIDTTPRGRRRASQKNLTVAISDINLEAGTPGNIPTPLPTADILTGTTLGSPSRPENGFSTPVRGPFSSAYSTFDIPATGTQTPTPLTYTPGTRKKKAGKHDLNGKLPPANVKFPDVPLTDTELIVFFFNSVKRPIVALRLQSRYGPSLIAAAINEYEPPIIPFYITDLPRHRHINPHPYERNTACIRVNGMVEKGCAAYGNQWRIDFDRFFSGVDKVDPSNSRLPADDAAATDAIRHSEDELGDTCDYPVLDLFTDMKHLPLGAGAGIFTRSVQWVRNNGVNIQVSQIHHIARALQNDRDPYEELDKNGINTRIHYIVQDDKNQVAQEFLIDAGRERSASLNSLEEDLLELATGKRSHRSSKTQAAKSAM
ncbi:hypothetical protein N0V90_011279 [Kalmusia sp. IMI 367209]|nr:hypothetical protein N0V90_011279 [Kalmusia sp. IMI 367209]